MNMMEMEYDKFLGFPINNDSYRCPTCMTKQFLNHEVSFDFDFKRVNAENAQICFQEFVQKYEKFIRDRDVQQQEQQPKVIEEVETKNQEFDPRLRQEPKEKLKGPKEKEEVIKKQKETIRVLVETPDREIRDLEKEGLKGFEKLNQAQEGSMKGPLKELQEDLNRNNDVRQGLLPEGGTTILRKNQEEEGRLFQQLKNLFRLEPMGSDNIGALGVLINGLVAAIKQNYEKNIQLGNAVLREISAVLSLPQGELTKGKIVSLIPYTQQLIYKAEELRRQIENGDIDLEKQRDFYVNKMKELITKFNCYEAEAKTKDKAIENTINGLKYAIKSNEEWKKLYENVFNRATHFERKLDDAFKATYEAGIKSARQDDVVRQINLALQELKEAKEELSRMKLRYEGEKKSLAEKFFEKYLDIRFTKVKELTERYNIGQEELKRIKEDFETQKREYAEQARTEAFNQLKGLEDNMPVYVNKNKWVNGSQDFELMIAILGEQEHSVIPLLKEKVDDMEFTGFAGKDRVLKNNGKLWVINNGEEPGVLVGDNLNASVQLTIKGTDGNDYAVKISAELKDTNEILELDGVSGLRSLYNQTPKAYFVKIVDV